MGLKFLLMITLITGLFFGCATENAGNEFYGKIVYRVTVGGQAPFEIIQQLQEAFGDSIAVTFTDKGYKLEVYNDTGITEWYENDEGLIYFQRDGVDTLFYEKASESHMLMTAEKRSDKHSHLGRDCQTYFLQDDQFHIEMWYDSTMHVSPKRFSRLYQGHYNRYYADCQAPYLVRSLVMAPVNIRIEAMRIEAEKVPNPKWSKKPDLPMVEFLEGN